jgi:hypothetical protein
MANVEDLLFSCYFMDFIKPNKILELGAASGAWGSFINYFSSSDIHFDLVENFNYARRNFDQGQPWAWPSNKEELEAHVNAMATKHNKPINFNILNMDAKDCLTLDLSSYGVIRWDCDFRGYNNIIKNVATSMKDSAVIFVDDTAINKLNHRLITMMNLVNEGIVVPVWFGNNQSIWAKSTFPRSSLFKYLDPKKDRFLDYRQKTDWPSLENGPTWYHCTTSSYDFRKNFRTL